MVGVQRTKQQDLQQLEEMTSILSKQMSILSVADLAAQILLLA